MISGEKANMLAYVTMIVTILKKICSDINKCKFERIRTFETLYRGVSILAFPSTVF